MRHRPSVRPPLAAALGGVKCSIVRTWPVLSIRHGSNRSATVTMAVVMALDGCSLAEAWAAVCSRRSEAAPLTDNRKQLLQHELAVRGSNSMAEATGGTLCPLPTATAAP